MTEGMKTFEDWKDKNTYGLFFYIHYFYVFVVYKSSP